MLPKNHVLLYILASFNAHCFVHTTKSNVDQLWDLDTNVAVHHFPYHPEQKKFQDLFGFFRAVVFITAFCLLACLPEAFSGARAFCD